MTTRMLHPTDDRRSASTAFQRHLPHVGITGLLLIVTLMPARATTPDLFQPVGNLLESRGAAQATLLTDGTVLITGGNQARGDIEVPLASAELFDPATNQFKALSPMGGPRDDSHRAVRLPDGRVLITGGSPDFKAHLRSAELYDPSSRTFVAVAAMKQDRAAHTATLLLDGKVLVAGGWGSEPEEPKASAELFDPATSTFQPTGAMKQKRYRHAAVPLPDGRVVILGGYPQAHTPHREVEIYDPRSGNFTPHGRLIEGRGNLTASLLSDGRILVVGGYKATAEGLGVSQSAEIYDPATGQSAVIASLKGPRTDGATVLMPDGRVLVASGFSGDRVLETAELIDPLGGKVETTATLATPRAGPAYALLLDGRVLIAGGYGGPAQTLASAEMFVPRKETD